MVLYDNKKDQLIKVDLYIIKAVHFYLTLRNTTAERAGIYNFNHPFLSFA